MLIFRRIFNSCIDPTKYLYSSNLCSQLPFFQPTKHLIIHSSTKLFIQSVIHPSGISLSTHLTTWSAIYPFSQRRAINSSNNQSNHSDSINLCTHPSSFQPPKHLIIDLSTKLIIRSVIHPGGSNLSIHLYNQPAILPFIHPKTIRLINHPSLQSSIRPSNPLLPAFQLSKKPLV